MTRNKPLRKISKATGKRLGTLKDWVKTTYRKFLIWIGEDATDTAPCMATGRRVPWAKLRMEHVVRSGSAKGEKYNPTNLALVVSGFNYWKWQQENEGKKVEDYREPRLREFFDIQAREDFTMLGAKWVSRGKIAKFKE